MRTFTYFCDSALPVFLRVGEVSRGLLCAANDRVPNDYAFLATSSAAAAAAGGLGSTFPTAVSWRRRLLRMGKEIAGEPVRNEIPYVTIAIKQSHDIYYILLTFDYFPINI